MTFNILKMGNITLGERTEKQELDVIKIEETFARSS